MSPRQNAYCALRTAIVLHLKSKVGRLSGKARPPSSPPYSRGRATRPAVFIVGEGYFIKIACHGINTCTPALGHRYSKAPLPTSSPRQYPAHTAKKRLCASRQNICRPLPYRYRVSLKNKAGRLSSKTRPPPGRRIRTATPFSQ